ncbi:MAG TPA: glycine dehydrogenase, partial [Thermomicrobiales bacterium]|nr:glycine dehydrogenase [Thermomicrobiales bacterium]
GFREVARRSYDNAHYLAERLADLPGWSLPVDAPFFNEFVARAPESAAAINDRLLAAGIIGGFDLSRLDADLDHDLLLCATELNDRRGIDRFVEVVSG